MLDQNSRSRMVIGTAGMDRLAAASVILFGLGGVGSYTAEALARGGIGRLTVVDNDRISLSNINRQLLALHSTVGRYKTDVARERLLDINPHMTVEPIRCFYGPDTANAIDFSSYDYVLDAIDTVTAKLEIIVRARAAGVPVISCMGTGNKTDPSRICVADIAQTSVCPLARVMRRELRTQGIDRGVRVVYSPEPPRTLMGDSVLDGDSVCVCPPQTTRTGTSRRQVPGSLSFVPPVAGLMMAGEVIRDLAGLRCEPGLNNPKA